MDESPFSDEQIIEALEEDGCSWRDCIFVGDPPSICRWRAGEGLWGLIIEDDALGRAAEDFLARRGVRRFASMEELKIELGWDGVFRPKGR